MNIKGIGRNGQVQNLPFAFARTLRPQWVGGLLLPVIGMALWFNVAQAQSPVGSYAEEEAQSIDQMLMCPVCPAESIDQAQVPLAKQMRRRVRELLAQGATRQEVLDYFADRYGQSVLASPPKSGINLLAWALPIAGLLAALAGLMLVLWAMKGRGEEQEGVGPEDGDNGDLAPYLEAVDRSLALDEPGGGEEGLESEGKG